MKVTAILSSPSRNGNTAVLAREAMMGAMEGGAECEEIFLADYNIEFCRGCMTCMKTGKCPVDDDFEALREKVYQSDGIILASPSYGLAPNARMKNFFTDRMGMFTVYTSSLGGKYFLGFSTAGGVGADKVAKDLAYSRTFGIFKRAYSSGYLGVILGNRDFKGMKRIEDCPDKIHKAYNLGKKLVNDFKKKKRFPFQNLLGAIVSNLILKGIMRKNLYVNKNGYMKGVYENLKRRNMIDF